MTRFMSTTALLLAMTGAAQAQSADNFGSVTFGENDFYATDLIGSRIYNAENPVEANSTIVDGTEKDWDDLGEINDLIITEDGNVSAVILGIGGFLGMGERDIAVSMQDITVVHEEGDADDRFLVVSTPKETLEAAPPFERADRADRDNTDNLADTDASTSANATNRTMLNRPTVAREGYEDVDMETAHQMTAEDLDGATVYGSNDEDVGSIKSLIMGDDGKVKEVVIDVGGFLGIGAKQVAVTFDELQILRQKDGDDVRIYIDSTKDALEAQPEYKEG